MNLLLDTNVVIDYLGHHAPFFEDAERIMAAGYFGDAQLWVSALSLKEAFYVLDHYVESSRIQDSIISLAEVVKPVGVSADDAVRAARLKWGDYEDCLTALCAEKAKADYLITRDARGFKRSAVPTMSPAEWLSMMEREKRLTFAAIDF